jgi:hypothetical protein
LYGFVVSRVPSSATFQYSVSALAPLDCLQHEQKELVVMPDVVTCQMTLFLMSYPVMTV